MERINEVVSIPFAYFLCCNNNKFKVQNILCFYFHVVDFAETAFRGIHTNFHLRCLVNCKCPLRTDFQTSGLIFFQKILQLLSFIYEFPEGYENYSPSSMNNLCE